MMKDAVDQCLYSLRATAEDCGEAGEPDRDALLRACEATISEALNRRAAEIERLRELYVRADVITLTAVAKRKGTKMALKRQELPRYFDNGIWRRVPTCVNVKRSFIAEQCALCGWGRRMAIHSRADIAAPTGPIGLHRWVDNMTPNV